MRLIDADALFDFLEEQLEKETGMYSKGRNVGINIARSALHDKTIAPTIALSKSNAPLTLEELREMDGDKIYIHYIHGFYQDEDGPYFGKYEQFIQEYEGRLTACDLPLEYYEKEWLAYRRKPEEVT